MNTLERRYRRVLRLLPAEYRLAWEEEMVATFLATMDTDDPEQASYLADYGRPSWSEVASVVALAVRLRVGEAGAPRYVAWGAALRIVALVGLLVHATTGLGTSIGFRLWLTGRLPLLPAPPPAWAGAMPHGAWNLVLELTSLVWLAAFLALVLDNRAAARTLAGIGLTVSIVDTVKSTMEPFVVTRWTHLLVNVALVLALVAFHPDAPAPARRPWLVALPIGAAVMIALQLLLTVPVLVLVDWPAICAAAFVVAALVHLTVPARRHVVDWTHALALLGGAVLIQRLLTLVDYATGNHVPDSTTALLLGVAEAGMVLVLLVPLWHSARQTLHQLAPAPMEGARW